MLLGPLQFYSFTVVFEFAVNVGKDKVKINFI